MSLDSIMCYVNHLVFSLKFNAGLHYLTNLTTHMGIFQHVGIT